MAKGSTTQRLERRIYPRCDLDTDVLVEINSRDENLQFSVKSINISLRGIELSCDDSLIQAILAQNTYPHVCQINFRIPGHANAFDFKSQVITHRRLSQNHYQLVFLFVDLSKELQECLINELASFRVVEINGMQRKAIAV